MGTGAAAALPNVGTAGVTLTPLVLDPNINSVATDCPLVVVAELPGIVLAAPKAGVCALPKGLWLAITELFVGAKKFVTFAEGVAVSGMPKEGAVAFGGTAAPVDGEPKTNVDLAVSVTALAIVAALPNVNGLLFSIDVIELVTTTGAPKVGILSELAGVVLAIVPPPNANVEAVVAGESKVAFGVSFVFSDADPPKLNVGIVVSAVGLSSFG